MSVSVSELVSVTSILFAVCLLALLLLVIVCRLLLSCRSQQEHSVHQSTNNPVLLESDIPHQQQCSVSTMYQTDQQQELCQLIQERGPNYKTQDRGSKLQDYKAQDYTGVITENVAVENKPSDIVTTVEKTCIDSDTYTDINTNGATEEVNWLGMHSAGGAIQRALSCDSVLSDTSVNELDSDDSAHRVGQLEFSLQYLTESEELLIMVIQARDLERDQITGSLDSYVRVSLTPNSGNHRSQTRVVRDTIHPQFMDCFTYRVDTQTVQTDNLSSPVVQFQVFSCDKYARHRLLGETELRLSDVDLQNQQTVQVWMNLHEIDEKPVDRGDVLVSMSYLPTAERLILVIVKARNLSLPSTKPAGDCCFKVYQLQNGSRIAKKKTSYKREDRNPIFNEAMVFSLPRNLAETVQLKISAILVPPGDRGAICVGHMTLGPQTTGTELVHWTQSMTSLRRPVTMWHSLR